MTEPRIVAPALPPPSNSPHVPTAPERVFAPRGTARWWGIPLVAVSFLVLLTIAGAALLPSQLVADKSMPDPNAEGETLNVETPYALVPAAAQPVANRVSYGDDLGDDIAVDTDPDGRVFFVTIAEPPQSLLGYWVGQDEPEILFTTYAEKYGGQTPSQQRTVSLQMMSSSAQVAQYYALTLAGYDARLVPHVLVAGAGCVEVLDNRCVEEGELRDELQVGDEVVNIDGAPVGTSAEIAAALVGRKPGDVVEVVILRQDEGEMTLQLDLVESPVDAAVGIIGILPYETASVDLPFEMTIDTGEIGGPSAGLAFTLTLIDELTDGDLLGGLDVAVTGTIELDGSVGAIGGLPQKASAVRQAGLDYFLVPATQPPEELAAAREIAGEGVELIPVANVDEALAALAELGGDPLP